MEAAVAEADFNPLVKLNKDLREASKTLTRQEARFLVDYYYQIQEDRISLNNQIRALEESNEPHSLVDWVAGNMQSFEGQIKRALDYYSDSDPVGEWSRGIHGIGPVIAAGLLAHIDIEQAPTAGHIWSFAGYNPDVKWLGQEKAKKVVAEFNDIEDIEELIHALAVKVKRHPAKLRNIASKFAEGKPITRAHLVKALSVRPWNAKLKTLCWKIGESFVKVSNKPDAFYGQFYQQKKAEYTERNENGDYAEQAAQILEEFNYGKTTDAYKAYSQGKLPPAHIHARAKRKAVSLFLAHWHHVAYVNQYGKLPPNPYPIEHQGHAHYIAPPNQ